MESPLFTSVRLHSMSSEVPPQPGLHYRTTNSHGDADSDNTSLKQSEKAEHGEGLGNDPELAVQVMEAKEESDEVVEDAAGM